MTQHAGTTERNRVLVGDARRLVSGLAASSVDMVLTSPPYFRLRNYDVADQLGTEAHIDDWVAQLGEVVRQLGRVLTPTGTLWLNLGDTYATHPSQGADRKSLLLGPERLVRALVADGWHLRNKIIWQKTNPVPTSVADRLASTWEVIYLLSPSTRYFFDLDAVRVPHTSGSPQPRQPRSALPIDYGRERWRGSNADSTTGLDELKRLGRPGHPLGKNPGDVWSIATSRAGKGHHATYPLQLAERALRAGCPEARCTTCRAPWHHPLIRHGDGTATRRPLTPTCDCRAAIEPGLVLDPFLGTGTTAVAAESLGRDWLGFELSSEFAHMAEQRISAARAVRTGTARASPAA